MDELPSKIVFDIFSRVPAKCLARSRCVSKVWCNNINDRYLTNIHKERVVEEPTPILYHQHLSCERITLSLCFHVIESKQAGTTDHRVFEPKKGPFLEFMRKKPLSKSTIVRMEVQGSCHGLICLSQDDSHVITSLFVIHPLRKECYELPPFPLRFEKHMRRESCGLGYDASTNTYKLVCVLLKEFSPPYKPDMVRKNLCTMVHVIGTNSWREIPQVPCYPVTRKGVFANGCLHWLVSHSDVKTDGGRQVIWFDVNKEEFGVIDPPKNMCDLWRKYSCRFDHLVDLNGEVGYVCSRTMEVWLLNHKKEWVPHCEFKKEIVPEGYIDVMGCWNKAGDILIKSTGYGNGMYAFFVYNLKSGALQKTNIVGPEDGCSPIVIMYPNNLLSIHGINTRRSSYSLLGGKTHMKKSCQEILSSFV